MRTFAIIVAAGYGQRFGGKFPKQFCPIGGFVPLEQSIELFLSCEFISGVICVIPAGYLNVYIELVAGISDVRLLLPVFGGNTRQKSVSCGLDAIAEHNPDYVMVHDASRCYCRRALLSRIHERIRLGSEAVIPVISPVDSVRYDDIGVSRDRIKLVQTPQAFKYDTIRRLHKKYADKMVTDDASLCDIDGVKVDAIEGDRSNIKLTYKSDIAFATYRTGHGYDAHRFSSAPKRELYLMGVKIEGYSGLEGISDADVGVHSLVDAILGALCLGSIGDHFPEHDPKNKGVCSLIFLEHCREFLTQASADIVNIDTTIVCEEPRVSGYSENMKKVIADCLKIDRSIINIKGKTNEGMGFEGRREGISATSLVTIRIIQ
ncbi:MAG: 2-C-methyl-D-erythritol 2,4-cyclodiphosphate synthase [Alphaproteobacteria bacterium]|nr:2-C-methyl-D-erythritol 2,4-cyclodiphosphate synthase [Alphaproteobacteria bacterium]